MNVLAIVKINVVTMSNMVSSSYKISSSSESTLIAPNMIYLSSSVRCSSHQPLNCPVNPITRMCVVS